MLRQCRLESYCPPVDQVRGSRSCQDNIKAIDADDSESSKVAEKASGDVGISEKNEQSAEIEVIDNISEDFTKEIDKDELARYKIIDKIPVYAVAEGVGTGNCAEVIRNWCCNIIYADVQYL